MPFTNSDVERNLYSMVNECDIHYHHKGHPRTFFRSSASPPLQSACLSWVAVLREIGLSGEPIGNHVPHARRAYRLQTAPRGKHRASYSASRSFAYTDRNSFPTDPTGIAIDTMSKYQAVKSDYLGPGVVKVERISDQKVPKQPCSQTRP